MSVSNFPLAEPLLARLLAARSFRGTSKLFYFIALLIGLYLAALWDGEKNQSLVGRPIQTDGEQDGEGGEEGNGEGGEAGNGEEEEKSGIVVRWMSDRGFGFIRPDDGGQELFAHVRSLVDGEGSVNPGDKVTFIAVLNERKGNHEAQNVKFVSKGEDAPEGDGAECKGTIARWMSDRGFGFIEVEGEEEQLFAHIRGFENPDSFQDGPQEGDEVTCKKQWDIGKGKFNAREVNFVSRPDPPPEEEGQEGEENQEEKEEEQASEGKDEASESRRRRKRAAEETSEETHSRRRKAAKQDE